MLSTCPGRLVKSVILALPGIVERDIHIKALQGVEPVM